MFDKQTSAGYKIITIIPYGNREHVIVKRSMSWGDDYVVGLGYHRDDGTWDQGMYSYDTIDEALEALINAKFFYRKNSLIKKFLAYIDWNTDSNEELYKVLIDQVQMTESEINDWGYGYCIPEKEEYDVELMKENFNVEFYVDSDCNVDIDINETNVTHCDGETVRNNAEIDGITPQEWIDAFVIDPLETAETLEQVLDEIGLTYAIGDTVYDLIDDYTASDAHSEEDVARLRAMSPERLQEVFRCTEGITFIKTKNQYALVWAEN